MSSTSDATATRPGYPPAPADRLRSNPSTNPAPSAIQGRAVLQKGRASSTTPTEMTDILLVHGTWHSFIVLGRASSARSRGHVHWVGAVQLSGHDQPRRRGLASHTSLRRTSSNSTAARILTHNISSSPIQSAHSSFSGSLAPQRDQHRPPGAGPLQLLAHRSPQPCRQAPDRISREPAASFGSDPRRTSARH